MPELPEVETIRRELEPLLVGRKVLGVKVGRPDIIGWPRSEKTNRQDAKYAKTEFVKQSTGLRIRNLGRRGKYLLVRGLRGSEERTLIIHLRLSGHLMVRSSRSPAQRFERIRFNFSGGRALIFIEPRVLGRVYLVDEANLPPVLKGLKEMGLEPIQPAFNAEYLRRKVGSRKASIKALLLDQNITAGIGNIYSDEALFRAGIRPARPANRITVAEHKRLAKALRDVLHDGIKHMGTTMTDARYRRPKGMPGGFQKYLKVFDREGEGCKTCGTTIKSRKIGNRTTRYCPKCQR